MKPPNLAKWSNTDGLANLLIFAQALDELLFDHTIDSYKATALNAHSSVLELQFLANQLRNDRVRPGTLIPVIEELSDKVTKDPVISSSEGAAFKIYLERLQNERHNPSDLVAILSSLRIELDKFYWSRTKQCIQIAITKPKNNQEIIALANAFIVEAEIQNFSRSFIYHTVQRFFFKRECEPTQISSIDQIADFLAYFDETVEREYKAVLRGSKTFSNMSELAERFGIVISDSPPEDLPSRFKVNSFLGESVDFPLYLTLENLKARDSLYARDLAQAYVELLSDVYCFHVHEQEPDWNRTCLVLDKTDNYASILNPAVSPMKRGTRNTPVRQADFSRTVEIMQGEHFVPQSRHVFLKALDYHRTALEATTPQNQLLDLWAALEGFSPPPNKDGDRISHYVSTLLPSLNLTYSEKIFRYVAESLSDVRGTVNDLVTNISIEGDFFAKTVCLLVANEYEREREDLYSALDDHPLLRFRCFTIHNQFNSAKHTRRTIVAHKQRVGWHIQRIYATRNQIMHSADALPYIGTLVENLHSYVDTLMSTIITVGLKSNAKISVPGALKLLSVQEQSYLRDLEQSSENCSESNFKTIVFGLQNPMSPFRESLSL